MIYTCNNCDYTSGRAFNISRHLKLVHNINCSSDCEQFQQYYTMYNSIQQRNIEKLAGLDVKYADLSLDLKPFLEMDAVKILEIPGIEHMLANIAPHLEKLDYCTTIYEFYRNQMQFINGRIIHYSADTTGETHMDNTLYYNLWRSLIMAYVKMLYDRINNHASPEVIFEIAEATGKIASDKTLPDVIASFVFDVISTKFAL